MVERRQRRWRDHDVKDAEEGTVLGVDTARNRQDGTRCKPAQDRLADEQAVKFSIEMDTKMIAVAEIGRGERRVKGGRSEIPIGADKSSCLRGDQHILFPPSMEIE